MTGTAPLRIGIVGAGGVTTGSHLPALRRLDDARVLWVCDRSSAAAEKAARSFDVPGWHTTLDECAPVDIVLLATPLSSRATLIPAVLERGWHLLSEKPFASSLADHDRFVELGRRAGLQVGVGQVRRFANTTATARDLVQKQVFGKLVRVAAIEGMGVHNTGRGADWHLVDGAVRNGVLQETGSHLVDQLLFIAGATAISVTSAEQRVARSVELESEILAELTLSEDLRIPARIQLSMLRDLANGLYLEFERALVRVGTFFADTVDIIDARGARLAQLTTPHGTSDAALAFALEWQDFMMQVRSGQPGTVDALSVRGTTELIATAYDVAVQS